VSLSCAGRPLDQAYLGRWAAMDTLKGIQLAVVEIIFKIFREFVDLRENFFLY
jgi:hypothetical protein